MSHNFEKISHFLESENTTPKICGGLLKGGIYAVKVQPAPLRMLLIRRAILENLARNIQCVVVTSISAEKFISNMEEENLQIFIGGLNSGKLKIVLPIGDFKKNIFRFGSKRFLNELEQFWAQGMGVFILDQAEQLFSVDDSEILKSQVQTYIEWMMHSRNTGLFLFPNSADFDNTGPYFELLSSYFNGIASFYMLRSNFEIGVDFWTTQSEIIFSKPMPVNSKDGGLADIQLSLAMDRRNQCRSDKNTTPKNEPKFNQKESASPQRWSHDSETANHTANLAIVLNEKPQPNPLPDYPHAASVSRLARHTESAAVPTKQRLSLWTGRVALFVTAAVAIGALAVTVGHSNFRPINSVIALLSDMLAEVYVQNDAIAARNAKPLPGLSNNVSGKQTLQKSITVPPVESVAFEPMDNIGTKPTGLRELVETEPTRQVAAKRADSPANVSSQDRLKASANLFCPDHLNALALCGTSSR